MWLCYSSPRSLTALEMGKGRFPGGWFNRACRLPGPSDPLRDAFLASVSRDPVIWLLTPRGEDRGPWSRGAPLSLCLLLYSKLIPGWRQTLFFGGSNITADGDCSHEINRRLLLGRKVMTNLAAAAAAAAAVKSCQLCPTLCDPIDSSPPSSSVPGILQAKILEWAHLDSIFKSRDVTCQ